MRGCKQKIIRKIHKYIKQTRLFYVITIRFDFFNYYIDSKINKYFSACLIMSNSQSPTALFSNVHYYFDDPESRKFIVAKMRATISGTSPTQNTSSPSQ